MTGAEISLAVVTLVPPFFWHTTGLDERYIIPTQRQIDRRMEVATDFANRRNIQGAERRKYLEYMKTSPFYTKAESRRRDRERERQIRERRRRDPEFDRRMREMERRSRANRRR